MVYTRFLFYIIYFAYCSFLSAGKLELSIESKSAVLINADSEILLFEKNARDKMYPASITKVATCLYALHKSNTDLNEIVSFPNYCLFSMDKILKVKNDYKYPAYLLEPDGSHFWIKRGEKISLKELLYGAMLASGNDAANCIAHHIGGSIFNFMQELNIYIKNLGCTNTNFANPHGLHHPNHFTTALDLSIIIKEALKYDIIKDISITKEYRKTSSAYQHPMVIKQKNLLLIPGKFFYSKAVGIKNGYNADSGFTLAAVAKDKDRTLIAVLLSSKNRDGCYKDAIRLFEAAFNEKKDHRLLFNKNDNVFSCKIYDKKIKLDSMLKEDAYISYYPSEESDIKIEIDWKYPDIPIKKGSHVGNIKVLEEKSDKELGSFPLISIKTIEEGFVSRLIKSTKLWLQKIF